MYSNAVDVRPLVASLLDSVESPVEVGKEVSVKFAHSAAVPVNVEVHDPEVGPVALPMLYPDFKLEYPEQVAAAGF